MQHDLNKACVRLRKLALIDMYKKGLQKLLMKNASAKEIKILIAGSVLGLLEENITPLMYGTFAENIKMIVTIANILVVCMVDW